MLVVNFIHGNIVSVWFIQPKLLYTKNLDEFDVE